MRGGAEEGPRICGPLCSSRRFMPRKPIDNESGCGRLFLPRLAQRGPPRTSQTPQPRGSLSIGPWNKKPTVLLPIQTADPVSFFFAIRQTSSPKLDKGDVLSMTVDGNSYFFLTKLSCCCIILVSPTVKIRRDWKWRVFLYGDNMYTC